MIPWDLNQNRMNGRLSLHRSIHPAPWQSQNVNNINILRQTVHSTLVRPAGDASRHPPGSATAAIDAMLGGLPSTKIIFPVRNLLITDLPDYLLANSTLVFVVRRFLTDSVVTSKALTSVQIKYKQRDAHHATVFRSSNSLFSLLFTTYLITTQIFSSHFTEIVNEILAVEDTVWKHTCSKFNI